MRKNINRIEFTPEELKVLQVAIEDVRQTEGELLVKVLENYLGRTPTNEDGEKTQWVINQEAEIMHYSLVYDGIKLGEVHGETNKKGGVSFTFTPVK